MKCVIHFKKGPDVEVTSLEAAVSFLSSPFFEAMSVYGTDKKVPVVIRSEEDYDEYRRGLEQKHAWKPFTVFEDLKELDAVNPYHYKNYTPNRQWIEMMADIEPFRDHPERLRGGLELMVRNYLDRMGKKGETSQDLRKGLVYAGLLLQFLEGRPLNVEKIQKWLKEV
jgi:hypothetical protein